MKQQWTTSLEVDPERGEISIALDGMDVDTNLLAIGKAFEHLGIQLQIRAQNRFVAVESIISPEDLFTSLLEGEEVEEQETVDAPKASGSTKKRSYYRCPYDGCDWKTKDRHGIGGHIAGHRSKGEYLPETEPKEVPASHLPRMQRRSRRVEQNIREQMQWLIDNYVPDKSLIVPKNKRACPICGQIVDARRGFGGHMAKHYREAREKPYLCRVCGKRFRYPHGLEHHAEVEHGIKQMEA